MTADTVGGVWTYAMQLSQDLVARGAQVSLATMGAPLSAEQHRQSQDAGVRVYESTFKLEWMVDPWRDVDAAGEWLVYLQARLQPDLVHLNGYAHGNLEWNVPTVIVGHSCVYSWWNAVHAAEPPAEWFEYRRRIRHGLQSASMVVGVSRAMLRELQRWYGVASGAVIYNGLRCGASQPAPKEPFVLSCGRLWDAAKNMSILDAAASMTQWPVYVAGEAQHPDGGKNSLQHDCALGQFSSEELHSWYARAGIYAAPALYEPFGLSILEAALSGCALVLGDIPSLREIWGEAAIYVPPSDPEALAVCVNALIARKEQRGEMGRRARARALGFTTERMTQSYLNVYQQARARFGAAREVDSSCVS
jgi:glycosyltransferase involved in cell wall biosynthesis